MKRRTVVAAAIAATVIVTGCQHPHHNHSWLACVRGNESGQHGYTAQNPRSSASGAYQMVNGTWRTISREMGVGTEYAKAKHAPPVVQDAVAYYAIVDPGHYRGHWTGANRRCFR